MKQLLLGSLLAAVALFIWGAVFWMSPLSNSVLAKVQDDEAAGQALLEHFPESGTYVIPGDRSDESTFMRLHEAGPIATIHLRREGCSPMDPKVFISGFLHGLLVCFLLGLMMKMALPGLPTYGLRVGFATLSALTAAVFLELGEVVWWYQPWGLHLLNLIWSATAGLIAGLVLAYFLRPGPAAAAA